MQGIQVFSSLAEAEAAGFIFYLRAADTLIVQRADGHLRALAVVDPAAGRTNSTAPKARRYTVE
jgi:hypothetical protein